ncbi:3-hydroxyacyl-CoA dehydrogenase (plasmid) [Rhizobium leguminosarum bv. trifolii CB782]|uniref:carnitine 3-dehydrogenase n=2 Tax=Rhizobium TaxID=379 RepID=UPI0003E2F5C9|nr:carnitine 3-dehydrogenase [Rhizobium hidalgonense]AHG48356.1 3-hydroxyacyl-CoA dehydrogenase [Rhizobium leguminosarum bv. trifolii CB782]QKK26151.1 carnitine 3-dehydrogenase [Rhizobium hidalgonense]RWX18598.1 carnitine 3-dehydrogenase [Rhizobium hidalgonense]
MTKISKAACIGGGVIGGGWIARFLLAGIDVDVFDPHPEAGRIVGEVIANAEKAYAMLTGAPLPQQGRLRFCATLEEAVTDADWIQESVPERLDLKRRVLTEIDAAARPDALIGSSTSGLLPTDLQRDMNRPERLFVAHPYNPVYLLPLVEIVGGAKTSAATIHAAMERLPRIGMKGVHIAKEIEAFVGDRLLEALWREALWLIHDDICTVETLDDVIRYSFGLRWAQMGLFQTYRIAGGEAGMRHFLAQFGPCLAWPWTKLTDVVDLDDALIEKIGRQSDEQAAGLSIRELERIRDENLVGILQALKGGDGGKGWGAGKLLKDFEQSLWADGGATASLDPSKPLRLVETKVSPAWVDYNGHMTEHRYLQVFGDTSDALLRLIGVDLAYVEAGQSYYTVESHIRHLGEAKLGQAIHSTCQVLAADEKRLHLFHTLQDTATGAVIATAEQMLLHVDSKAGKSVPAPAAVLDKIKAIVVAHSDLALPEGAGRSVGQRR